VSTTAGPSCFLFWLLDLVFGEKQAEFVSSLVVASRYFNETTTWTDGLNMAEHGLW
jgi:hypothetical protein